MVYRKKRSGVRRVGGRRRKRRSMRGAGFFGDLWSGIKKVAAPVHNFVKDNKLISRGLGLLGPKGKAVGAVADQFGYGRRRYRRRRMQGGALMPYNVIRI